MHHTFAPVCTGREVPADNCDTSLASRKKHDLANPLYRLPVPVVLCKDGGEPHTVECKAYEAWDAAVGFLPERKDADPVGELIGGDPDD